MPSITTRGAASSAAFGLAQSQTLRKYNYWIAEIGGGSNSSSDTITGGLSVIDSSGNVYVTGGTNSPANTFIFKLNSNGLIQWQTSITGASEDYITGIAIDSSANVYVVGQTNTTGIGGAGSYDLFIMKFNSSGTIQWQRVFGGAVAENSARIAVDSSGNAYISGYTENAGGWDIIVAKYDTSGTLQWQRSLSGSSTYEYGTGIAVDSSANVYVVGRGYNTYSDILLIKYDTSGTLLWQKRLTGSSTDESGQDVTVDSSGNVYVTANYLFSGDYGGLVIKYNSSGSYQWQRSIQTSGSGNGEFPVGITTDSSGNVYVTGSVQPAGSQKLMINKYDSTGAILFRRTIASLSTAGGSISIDSTGKIYVSGYSSYAFPTPSKLIIAKIPGDGTLTGTYGEWVYADSSAVVFDGAFGPSDTSQTLSLTSSASSFTSSTSTLTISTVTRRAGLTGIQV
jgi:outer membrane protein assembly factor BamB